MQPRVNFNSGPSADTHYSTFNNNNLYTGGTTGVGYGGVTTGTYYGGQQGYSAFETRGIGEQKIYQPGISRPFVSNETRQPYQQNRAIQLPGRIQTKTFNNETSPRLNSPPGTATKKEVIEEVERPHYQKLYSNKKQKQYSSYREPESQKKSCCSAPVWALLALLGLTGLILGLLFGLGVIGGKTGSNFGQNSVSDGVVTIDGVDYNKDSITIETQVLNSSNSSSGNNGTNSGVVIDGVTYPPNSIQINDQVLIKNQTSNNGNNNTDNNTSNNNNENGNTGFTFPPVITEPTNSSTNNTANTAGETVVFTKDNSTNLRKEDDISYTQVPANASTANTTAPANGSPTSKNSTQIISVQPIIVEPIPVNPIQVTPIPVPSINSTTIPVNPNNTNTTTVQYFPSTKKTNGNTTAVEPSIQQISYSKPPNTTAGTNSTNNSTQLNSTSTITYQKPSNSPSNSSQPLSVQPIKAPPIVVAPISS